MPTVPTGYTELDTALTKGADGKLPFAGKTVSIQTQWIGGEGTNFAASVADFAAATGIKIQIDSIGSSHETVLKTRIEGGKPPDLAMLAQPTPVLAYAAQGKVIDVAPFMEPRSSADEHANTIGLVTQGDKIWGIPYKADVKSTIWYPIKAFEAKGYTVPKTWDELIALSDKIVADGSNPWCVSAGGPGDATGWQLTDWVEEVVLKTKGADYYNDWISHKVTFEDPGIKDAFDKVGKIFFTPNYVFGTNTAIVPQDQKTVMDPMFTDDLANPKCWMQKIPTWYGPDFFPDQRASGQPVEVRHRDGRRHLPVPDHRPGPDLRRGLGRHAHGARRPARGSCRRRVPRHAARPPEVDRGRQRHLDQLHHPCRLVCRRLQAQGRVRDRERRQGHRLRRVRPHAGQGRRRNLLDQDGRLGQPGWHQHGCHSEGHRRQLARQLTI